MSEDSVFCIDSKFYYKNFIRHTQDIFCINIDVKNLATLKVKTTLITTVYPKSKTIKKALHVITGIEKAPNFYNKASNKLTPVLNKEKSQFYIENSMRYTVIDTYNKPDNSRLNSANDIVYVADKDITIENLNIQKVSNGELEDFNFIIQKNNFAIIRLNLKDIVLKDVLGLPEGMGFDGTVIKGTPLLSGKYIVDLIFEKNKKITGNIEVPELIRLL